MMTFVVEQYLATLWMVKSGIASFVGKIIISGQSLNHENHENILPHKNYPLYSI